MNTIELEDERLLAQHREMEKSRVASEATKKALERKGQTIWTKLAILAGLIGLIWYSLNYELVIVKAESGEKSLTGVPLLLEDGEGKVREATTAAFGARIFILDNEELEGTRLRMLPTMGDMQLVDGLHDGSVNCLDTSRMDVSGGCQTVDELNDTKVVLAGYEGVEFGFWRTLTANFIEIR